MLKIGPGIGSLTNFLLNPMQLFMPLKMFFIDVLAKFYSFFLSHNKQLNISFFTFLDVLALYIRERFASTHRVKVTYTCVCLAFFL